MNCNSRGVVDVNRQTGAGLAAAVDGDSSVATAVRLTQVQGGQTSRHSLFHRRF